MIHTKKENKLMKKWKKTKRERRRIKFLQGKLVKITINFNSREERLALTRAARLRGMNPSQFIRHALEEFVKEHKSTNPDGEIVINLKDKEEDSTVG